MVQISKKKLAARKARKAQEEMLNYMQEHNLDPKKDWTKDKKHGKKIQAWVDDINLGNKKSKELHREEAEERKLKKPDVNPKTKKVDSAPTVYDYPTINGQEMSQELRKKYRQKMRTLVKTMSQEKAEKEAKKYAEEVMERKANGDTKAKKAEKEKKVEKKAKKEKKVKESSESRHKTKKKSVEED